MAIKIITDSTTDVISGRADSRVVVPLTVHFGEEEYIDGVTINHKEFYEKLTSSPVMPSTSQATPAAFDKVFRQVTDQGDSAVVITIASQLSGTWQSAMIAAEDYDNIYVVDSGSVTIGAGILTHLAFSLMEQGCTAKQIAETLEKEKGRVCIVALVDTLEYLKRGGRISATTAFAGGLLNIKPILSVTNGVINTLAKARGAKQGNTLMLTQIDKLGGMDFTMPVMLGYTGVSDENLQTFITQNQSMWDDNGYTPEYAMLGSVIGTHAGPGAHAVAFFKKG